MAKGCFQYCKDTNLKANHNEIEDTNDIRIVVSNIAKILI